MFNDDGEVKGGSITLETNILTLNGQNGVTIISFYMPSMFQGQKYLRILISRGVLIVLFTCISCRAPRIAKFH